MTAPAAGFDDLRPAPRAALTGRDAPGSGAAPPAGRFSFFCASAASAACFLSIIQWVSRHSGPNIEDRRPYPSQPTSYAYALRNPPGFLLSVQ